jgi:general secretion pathway protein J
MGSAKHSYGAMLRRRQALRRGFTLLEVIVAIGITALISVLIYSTFHAMNHSRSKMVAVADRYQQGRASLERMARELSSAFISAHRNFANVQNIRQTGFFGSRDRVDFTAFAHRRLKRDAHESDQAELSFFVSRDPEDGSLDLARRLDKFIDDDPTRGGIVQVMAENLRELNFSYLDPMTGEWVDSWDSVQATSQPGRLPAQVAIVLVLEDEQGDPITFQTKVAVAMQLPLSFATD